MFPWEPTRDILRRTLFNLTFIEKHATQENGPYEVTQLINSFLGAVAHPWEEYRKDLNAMPLSESETWLRLTSEPGSREDPQSVGDALRLLRNGIAHGILEFLPGKRGEIQAIRIRNFRGCQPTWGAIVSVSDLRQLVDGFASIAEGLADQESGTRRRKA